MKMKYILPQGIWAGMIFGGTATQTLMLALITIRCNWDAEVCMCVYCYFDSVHSLINTSLIYGMTNLKLTYLVGNGRLRKQT